MNIFYQNVIHNAFSVSDSHGVVLLNINILNQLGFIHGFTTRIGGVSQNEFESLNLSLTREKYIENKTENYRRVCKALDIDYNSLTLVNYEHGNGVYILESIDRGKGILNNTDIPKCDGIITKFPDITAVTLHADCVPIFIVDKRKGIAGVAHAGWKGIILEISLKMIDAFTQELKSNIQDLIIAIGPHIMQCCFEIKSDVIKKFEAAGMADALQSSHNKIFANLQYVLLKQFKSAGVLPNNIFCADMCTSCNDTLFYSHRRDKGRTGAMGAFITAREKL